MGSLLDRAKNLRQRKKSSSRPSHHSQAIMEKIQHQGITMADEQIFTIPLRKEFHKVPTWSKAKKAVKATRQFLIKHTKAENVLLGKYLHEKLMEHGRQNPPHHVTVRVWKDGEKTKAELADAPREEKKVEEKTPAVKGAKPEEKKIPEKISEVAVTKAEVQKEKEEEEKKDVLEHQKAEHKERHPLEEGKPEDKKVMEKERHKNIRSHGQKPTHEKKK